jgi:DNA repair protein RecO (recombination protein O)
VDYRDSDRILTLLTRDNGKISALARGVRKSQKRFGGAIIPFAHMEVVLEKGRGHLLAIQEAALINANSALSTHLERLGGASYIVEIIRESTPDSVPDNELFTLLKESLSLIAQIPQKAITKTVIGVILKILHLGGIAVGLRRCNACNTPVPPGRPVLFHPGRGGVICTPCGGGPLRLEAETIDGLSRLIETPLDELSDIQLSPAATHQGEEALFAFMEHHLGKHLKTRAYFIKGPQNG